MKHFFITWSLYSAADITFAALLSLSAVHKYKKIPLCMWDIQGHFLVGVRGRQIQKYKGIIYSHLLLLLQITRILLYFKMIFFFV
jgi:hypothetical protein